ncbi:hypothetical protein SAY87_024142 [Trapa incisa]|uniref:RING-type E3 ubiquitin transferase n=1 Tax=Trapa incisa TaxID=236973 RepID=A0AAN7L7M6_9MYRT|nr:hypothetical protein SAY87_024142 [Trapa incisa]
MLTLRRNLWPFRLPTSYSFCCSFFTGCKFLGICEICKYKRWKWCNSIALSSPQWKIYPGSAPLHLAARGGSLDCVRELLAWGANRLQRDASGRIPYMVALKYKHGACAALLNPSAAEPLVWPSSMKFMRELNPEAKELLETALIEANKERKKSILKQSAFVDPLSFPILSDFEADEADSEDENVEICCICFDQACTIEVRNCGHQMCANCMLPLCCHKKPNPATSSTVAAPVCPFCRSSITRLVVVKSDAISHSNTEVEASPSRLRRPRKSVNLSEGSSSFKGLTAHIGKIAGNPNQGRTASECNEGDDKP